MADLFALAELIPEFEQAAATYKKLPAVLAPYAQKLSGASGGQPIDVAAILKCLAVFVPDLNPIIPDIVQAIGTLEKVRAILDAPAPENAPPWPQ
jgi:hypothetical protein